ncbi:hypothetical protein CEUSTIGMA_g12261.t1 [Chlamydomonas eustigma]|uniref:Tr-type G domain-containing protein n=1 Tax=Chlamydomonas eustigma TaxID=1157962 RepID=A0A250XPW3_9CHLO|nr:hypothetical protein CEUSTIGMA_g12261.t1 [Chlamydomonas eustigma]|eukprot:GAX84840.1 hypothetical protein CEUSTIGMA_g12261.t1 [Chlamydomonas eustigma]
MFDDDFSDVGSLGTRRAPKQWVSVDTTPPPKIKRRHNKTLKKEIHAAAKKAVEEALAAKAGPSGKTEFDPHEVQELTKAAMLESCQRIKLRKEPRDPNVKCLCRESDEGNVEYKLKLKDPDTGNPYRIQQLITQMKYRLAEGSGECFYFLGVEDDGYPRGLTEEDLQSSICTLRIMANSLGAEALLVRSIPGAYGRSACLIRVRRQKLDQLSFVDLRVSVSGGVDSGKSSLVAVLTHGSDGQPHLDNGRGSARMSVLRHKHELESGRTTSISQQVLGYGAEGEILNYVGVSTLTPSEICGGSSRLLTFIDMGGHERCLKTALWGMTCLLPDYTLLCVCAVGGLGRMSREHLAVAVALEIPIAVVLTKCDLVDAARLETVLHEVRELLSVALPGLRPSLRYCQRKEDLEDLIPHIQTSSQAIQCARTLSHMRTCTSLGQRKGVRIPVFATSAVTGAGLQLLHDFLRRIEPASVAQPPTTQGGSTPRVTSECEDQAAFRDPSQLSNKVVMPEIDLQLEVPLDLLPSQVQDEADWVGDQEDVPVLFQVDQTYEMYGVGSVVCGTVVQGVIQAGHKLMLGPDDSGAFMHVIVKECQRLHTPVASVRAGQNVALSLSVVDGPDMSGSTGNMAGSWPPYAAYCSVALGAGGSLNSGKGRRSEGGSMKRGKGGQGRSLIRKEDGDRVDADKPTASNTAVPEDSEISTRVDVGEANSIATFERLSGLSDLSCYSFGEVKQGREDANKFDDNDDCFGAALGMMDGFDEPSSPNNWELGEGPSAADDSNCDISTSLSTGLGFYQAHRITPASISPIHTNMNAGEPSAAHDGSVLSGKEGLGDFNDEVGGKQDDWFLDCELATSPPLPSFLTLSTSPPNSRKGAVLLDEVLLSCTGPATMQFEAVVVLLGGRWPARGLVSGRWPPLEVPSLSHSFTEKPDARQSKVSTDVSMPLTNSGFLSHQSEQLCASRPHSHVDGGCVMEPGYRQSGSMVEERLDSSISSSRLRQASRSRGGGGHTVIVHCGSVRQAAQVLWMQELENPFHEGADSDVVSGELDSKKYCGIRATAAILHHGSSEVAGPSGGSTTTAWSSVNEGSSNSSGVDEMVAGEREGGRGRVGKNAVRKGVDVGSEDLRGCIVKLCLRFMQRPEWLREGSKLIIRDRADGHIAGAGFVG